ncbi:hypothetical protein J2W35_003281 [Variovorax boronicumulans]|uniref:hypothetical protein n=1 Tax=Variovorax boronicumulans TaxID=436515 RepID=UPI0027804607|nr:hypothetical protein [Variovorax boronicumulans]MDQ0082922.1 hypothetical protein [Variovorax boronicumulans]
MNEQERISLAQSVKTVRENLPALMEMGQLNAQITRAKYLALVKEGFTEAQALDLCWRT